MIWFFLAGMISGAVGMMMYARWWVRSHTFVHHVTEEDLEELLKEMEDEKAHE